MKKYSVKPILITLLLMLAGAFSAPTLAVITFVGGPLTVASGGNQSAGAGRGSQFTIPFNGTLTPMTVPRPTGTQAGDALVAQFIVRPQGTSITSPSGWSLLRRTRQTSGGNNTPPCGLDIISYFRIIPAGEPAGGSDTWYISYPFTGSGWTPSGACTSTSSQNTVAIGGMLAFRGSFPLSPVYYSGEDTQNNGSSLTHFAPSINVGILNTMIVSGIGYLSSSSFGTPSRSGGVETTQPTVGLNQWACPSTNCSLGERVNNAVGLSLQMAYFNQGAAGNTGTVTATASGSGYADNGVGHMIAISETASGVDLAITKAGVISGTGPYTATYTINVKNNGATTEPGPITVVDSLPAGLTYVSASGTNWHCARALQTVTCVYGTGTAPNYTGIPLAYNQSAQPLTITASATISNVYTNTATVTGQAGDAYYADNTANRTNTIGNATLYSGTVYNDANRDSSLTSGETGIGQTLYIKVTPRSGGACSSPASMAIPTDPVTGAYGFGINSGNYCLILDTNNLLTDITPATPSSYIGTEEGDGVRNNFTAVAGTPQATLNFGLYQPANIKIIKTLSPTSDAGKFNLQVTGGTPTGGTNPATNVGNTGTTDYVFVSRSTAITVQETAGTGTSLSNYATTLSCTEGDGVTPVSLTASDLTNSTTRTGTFISPSPVFVGTKSQVICTFTNSTYDYGDAPDTTAGTGMVDYQTLAANSGPAHLLTPTLKMGGAITDADDGTLQNSTASQDDNNNTDDEDGVASFNPLTVGAANYSVTVSTTNSTGDNAMLHGWIDFNKNGNFETTEHASALVANGATSVELNWASIGGLTTGTTYARFRIASSGLSNASGDSGIAASGEIEDYALTISELDYGDAPSGGTVVDVVSRNYGSATHGKPTTPTVYLGNAIPDADTAANQTTWQAQTTANGDDTTNTADEGIAQLLASGANNFPTLTTSSGSYSLTLRCAGTTTSNAVSGWIDLNKNGAFDTGERAQGTCSSTAAGTVTLNWSSLTGLMTGDSFSRFRIASNASELASPTGAAADGEVEDYPFTIGAAVQVISGIVFKDTGTGSGIANNGIKDGTELGIASVTVKLTDCAVAPATPTVYSTATTDGSGNYSLAIGTAPAGTVCVEETNLSSHASTGANVGGTALPDTLATPVSGTTYTYSRTTDKISFTLASNTNYTGLNFGDVPASQFITDGAKTGAAGSTLTYPHTFIAGTGGSVSFSLPGATASPAIPGWDEVLYIDTDCNGSLDGNEGATVLSPSAITVVEGQTVCLIQKEFISAGAAQGASNLVPVQAVFDYNSTVPNATYTRQDVTTVSSTSLLLVKEVSNVSSPTTPVWKTSNKAKSGEILEYRITYTNNGPDPINELQINDATPSFTTFVSGLCETAVAATPTSLGLCTLTKTLTPPANNTGSLKWTFSTTAPAVSQLLPGGTGSVTYRVKVD